MKYAGLLRAGDVRRERELPFEAHDAERDVLLLVAAEVHADLLAAALRLRDQVEPAVVADERAHAVPVAGVEEASRSDRARRASSPRSRPRHALAASKFPRPAHERRFHRHHRGPHGLRRLLERVAEHVLQDDRAPLRHRQREKARERRAHDRRIGLVLEPGDLVDLGVQVDVFVAVALQEIDRRVVRDAKQPGAQRRHLGGEAQRVERLGERVLDDVLALDDRAGEARAVAMQLGAHAVDHGQELLARIGEGRRRLGHAPHAAHVRAFAPLARSRRGAHHVFFGVARIRLFFGLCSTSARPSASSTGGTYIPKRPRSPFFRPYQPLTGLVLERPQASTVPSAAGFCSSALPSEHPVAVLRQHGVQIVDAAQVIAKLRLADLHDERRRIGGVVPVRLVVGGPGRRLQLPRFFRGPESLALAHDAVPAVGVDRGELRDDRRLDAAILELRLKCLERRQGHERVLVRRLERRDVNERDPVRESVGRVAEARGRARPQLVEHGVHERLVRVGVRIRGLVSNHYRFHGRHPPALVSSRRRRPAQGKGCAGGR